MSVVTSTSTSSDPSSYMLSWILPTNVTVFSTSKINNVLYVEGATLTAVPSKSTLPVLHLDGTDDTAAFEAIKTASSFIFGTTVISSYTAVLVNGASITLNVKTDPSILTSNKILVGLNECVYNFIAK